MFSLGFYLLGCVTVILIWFITIWYLMDSPITTRDWVRLIIAVPFSWLAIGFYVLLLMLLFIAIWYSSE